MGTLNFENINLGDVFTKNGINYAVVNKSNKLISHDMGGWTTKKVTLFNKEYGKTIMNCVKRGNEYIADNWWRKTN
jgi:triacylglycerol esterase/lipase EstA (alpha/beta hydrolase family)